MLLLLLLFFGTLGALLVMCEVKRRKKATVKKVVSGTPARSAAARRKLGRPVADPAVSPASSARPPKMNKVDSSPLDETIIEGAEEMMKSDSSMRGSGTDEEESDEEKCPCHGFNDWNETADDVRNRRAAKREFRKMAYEMTSSKLYELATKESGLSIELRARALSLLSHAIGYADNFNLAALADDLIKEFNISMRKWVKRSFGYFIGLSARRNGYERLNDLMREWNISEDVEGKQKGLELIRFSDNHWNEKRDWGQEAVNMIVHSIQGSNRSLRKAALEALEYTILDEDTWKLILPSIIQIAGEKCKGSPVRPNGIHQTECDGAHYIALMRLSAKCDFLRPHLARIVSFATQVFIHNHDCTNGGCPHDARVLIQKLLKKFGSDIPDILINDIIISCLIYKSNNETAIIDDWLSETPTDLDLSCGFWAFFWDAIMEHLGDGRCGEQMMSLTKEFYKSDDWSRRAAALVSWCYLIDETWGQERDNILIDHALLGFNDEHPRVRAAASMLIAAVSIFDDLVIEGYDDLPAKMVSSLVSLAADPVLPMRVRAVQALGQFLFEGIFTPELCTQNYDALLPLLIAIITDCKSPEPNEIHKNSLVLIAALGNAVGRERFKNDLPAIDNVVGPLLSNLKRSNESFDEISKAVTGMIELVANDDSQMAKWAKENVEEDRDDSSH